LTLTLQSMDRS